MAGTTISASSTIGLQLTLPSQNPVLVTSTGTIATTGLYAIDDTAAGSGVDMITNNGLLQGQFGIEFNGPLPDAVGVVNNLGKIVGTTNNAIYLQDGLEVNNGSPTDTTASITSGNADTILFSPQPEGSDLVINYGTISASIYAGAVNAISMDAGQDNTVLNYGTVFSVNYGIVTSGSGPATITNGSTAYTKAVITGISSEGALETDAVSNYGTISGDGNAPEGINAAGALSVTNAGTIIGPDGGIYAGGLGTVTNSGSIVEMVGGGPAIQLASGGSIANGSPSNTTASIAGGTGIILGYIGGTGSVISTPSQVTNFGTIAGTDGEAITTNDTGPVTITNGSVADTRALITSTFYTIATGIATLANFGTITNVSGAAQSVNMGGGSSITNGSTSDTVATISGAGGVLIGNNSNSTLSNFGTIAASAGSGVSGLAGSLTNGSATDVKASITGSAGGVNASGVTTVTNFGTISGAADYGVSLNSGTIDNYGSIVGGSGGIITGNGANVVNSGTIESSTTAGTALYFLTTGGTLVNDAGGVIGTTSGRLPTVVNDGTIVAGNSPANGGLDVFSAVDPSSSGVFQLTGKSTLEIAAYLGTSLKIQFLGSTRTNELIIDNAANFGVSVGSPAYAGPLLESFSAGDEIFLKGIGNAVLNYSAATGVLQVTSAGKAVATLLFQNASLGAGTFHVAAVGGSGSMITHS